MSELSSVPVTQRNRAPPTEIVFEAPQPIDVPKIQEPITEVNSIFDRIKTRLVGLTKEFSEAVA